MQEYESGWPHSFNRTLNKRIITMAVSKKNIKVDGIPIYDAVLIYTRVLVLQQSREINIKEVTCLTRPPCAVIIDGCALLWIVHWPPSGSVEDYIVNFMGTIDYHLNSSDVYLIFDRYLPGSTKHATRSNRAGKDAVRKHQLTFETPISAQQVILNVSHNKAQLIKLICQYLTDNDVADTHRLLSRLKTRCPLKSATAGHVLDIWPSHYTRRGWCYHCTTDYKELVWTPPPAFIALSLHVSLPSEFANLSLWVR